MQRHTKPDAQPPYRPGIVRNPGTEENERKILNAACHMLPRGRRAASEAEAVYRLDVLVRQRHETAQRVAGEIERLDEKRDILFARP